MKKLYIIMVALIPLLLTGCFGKNGAGYLTNTCTKNTPVPYNEQDTYVINFKSGVVNTVILTNSFSNNAGEAITSSLKSYEDAYKNTKGVTVSLSDDYTINYTFDLSKVSDDIKDNFKLKNSYNDQINILKENGYTCK